MSTFVTAKKAPRTRSEWLLSPLFPPKNRQNCHLRETAAIPTQYRRGNWAVLAQIKDPFPTGRTAQGVKAGLYNTGRHVRT